MVKISSARIDMERARIDNALLKDYGEILVGGATGANTGSAFSIDLSAANMFNLILNAPVVDMAFINAGPSGTMCSFTVILRQDSVGSRKISWPNTVLWDGGVTPALTTTPGRLDILSFMTPDGGRKWFGFMGQQNLTGLDLSQTHLWSWGSNNLGQLGTGDSIPRVIPTGISTDSWSFLSAGTQDSFGIKSDGSLWGWGSNVGGTNGELGDNTIVSKSSPVQIGTLTNWASVSTGVYRTSAIKTDGTLWGWGQNVTTVNGQSLVGDNTVVTRSSPVQIGTLTNWAKLPLTNDGIAAAAIDTSGGLWMWGANQSGELGDSTLVDKSSPVQIGTLTNWAMVTIGGAGSTNAIKTDGTLWGWGINTSSQLGDGTVTGRSSPIQIGTLTNWSQITAGKRSVHAIKTDGTLWAWGYNSLGQLGDGTTISRNVPSQVGTLTNWKAVSDGDFNTLALKTDGTLWAWGRNQFGQLGTGDQNNRSSPVQIGQANTWTQIAAGASHTVALKT